MIDYLPIHFRTVDLDLEAAQLGVVVTGKGDWGYRTTTEQHEAVCENTDGQ